MISRANRLRDFWKNMLDKDLINKKIRNIEEYIEEVKFIIPLSTKEIVSNVEKMRTLERNFQLVVDAMVDVNMHFIAELELESPDSFQNTFEILGRKNIIPYDFSLKVASVVGLRNKLVHQYEKVDRDFFVEQFKKEHKDFIEYIKYINKYLEGEK